MEDISTQSLKEQRVVGIEIARESVEAVRDFVSGVQISAPFGPIEIALAVVE